VISLGIKWLLLSFVLSSLVVCCTRMPNSAGSFSSRDINARNVSISFSWGEKGNERDAIDPQIGAI
jgi:hypothetical protein